MFRMNDMEEWQTRSVNKEVVVISLQTNLMHDFANFTTFMAAKFRMSDINFSFICVCAFQTSIE
jgi:hypothetical protein